MARHTQAHPTQSGGQDGAAWIYEQVQLPEPIRPGRFDAHGNDDPEGHLFVGQGGNICHIWAAFSRPVAPGEFASMTFTNVPGSYPLTGNFSEWIRGGGGHSPHAGERGARGSQPKAFRNEIGIWDISVDTYLAPGQPPVRVEAVETWRLGPNGWLTSEYVAENFLGMRFEQQAFLAWERDTDTYVSTRIKSLQDNIASYRGKYDSATKTLTLEADVIAGGVVEHERRETVYVDENTKRFRVYRKAEGQAYTLSDEGVGKRRPGPSNGCKPANDHAAGTLVSLSRGHRSARVIGRNETSGAHDMAGGIVILGMVYMLQFQGNYRP